MSEKKEKLNRQIKRYEARLKSSNPLSVEDLKKLAHFSKLAIAIEKSSPEKVGNL